MSKIKIEYDEEELVTTVTMPSGKVALFEPMDGDGTLCALERIFQELGVEYEEIIIE